MALILGFYGSANVQLGPNCSRLVEANSFFVQTLKVIWCILLIWTYFSPLCCCCRSCAVIFLVLLPGRGNRWTKTWGNAIWILWATSAGCWKHLVWEIWCICRGQFSQCENLPTDTYSCCHTFKIRMSTSFYHYYLLDALIVGVECMTILHLFQEWIFFLNKGSEVDISYSVKSPGSSSLSLVIAQGKF